MKRSWITWPIIGSVIVLLTIFLALQYRWQIKAGEAEREIMQKRVEADTRHFAEDFNREIQSAYFNFQMDADSWLRSDWNEFAERYDFWRSKTNYPKLIRDLYYLRSNPDRALRYDPDQRVFAESEISQDAVGLKKLVSDEKTFRAIYQEPLALALPIHTAPQRIRRIRIPAGEDHPPPVIEMPEREGSLLILLDRDVVAKQMLSELAAKHFPNGDYKIEIQDQDRNSIFQTAGGVSGTDAVEPLLFLSPDNLIFFANKNILPRSEEKRSGVVIDQHIESHSLTQQSTDSNATKTFTFRVNSDGMNKKAAIFTSSAGGGDAWSLGVQHSSGSIDAFIKGEQDRRLLTGLAIYLLVIGAIIAIAYSAMRSQKFAQRQIDFVSSVSHEFRTPLAVIYSAGENLADGVANDRSQIERYGTLIKSEGRKLSGMVEQILEFAGARSGKRKFSFIETDLNAVVENSLIDCEAELDQNGFAVEKELSTRLPSISADPEALTSAVQNLIQNAVKYSNGDRWIRVSTSFYKGSAAISVEDHGIGISASDLSKIFDPFYRSKEVVDAQIHGNGLGLSLVKEIVDAHRGTISARSEEGKGSKFTIELPLSEPPA